MVKIQSIIASMLYLFKNSRELMEIAQLHQIEPGQIHNPFVRFGLHHIQIQGSTSLNEGHELLVLDFTSSEVDFEGKEQSEGVLVLLIQTSNSILEHLKSHEINDVLNSLLCDWRFCRPV